MPIAPIKTFLPVFTQSLGATVVVVVVVGAGVGVVGVNSESIQSRRLGRKTEYHHSTTSVFQQVNNF